jgi:hypothetical protein
LNGLLQPRDAAPMITISITSRIMSKIVRR